MRAHSVRNNNQILRGGQTARGEIFSRSTTMLTRDLFAVVDLVNFRNRSALHTW